MLSVIARLPPDYAPLPIKLGLKFAKAAAYGVDDRAVFEVDPEVLEQLEVTSTQVVYEVHHVISAYTASAASRRGASASATTLPDAVPCTASRFM